MAIERQLLLENNDMDSTHCNGIDKIAIRRKAKMTIERQLMLENHNMDSTESDSDNTSSSNTSNTMIKDVINKQSITNNNDTNNHKKSISHVRKAKNVRSHSSSISNNVSTKNQKCTKVNKLSQSTNVTDTGNGSKNNEMQAILDRKMINASNIRMTRQKKRTMSARDVRALCRSKQRDIITTKSKIDDMSSISPNNIIEKRKRSVNVVTVVDNSSNKKQLTERTIRAFRRSHEQKEQVSITNNATIEEEQVNDDHTYSHQDSPEENVEAKNTEKLINTSRSERAASINAAMNIKQITNMENIDFDNLSDMSIGDIPIIHPPGDIFNDIILNDDKDDIYKDDCNIIHHDHASNHTLGSTAMSQNTSILNERSSLERSHACTQANNNTKIRDINDIIRLFKLPKTIKSSLPKSQLRTSHTNIESVNARGWKGMVNLSTMCCKQILEIICPGPSSVHLREHMIRFLVSEKTSRHSENKTDYKHKYEFLVKSMFDALKVSKKGSIQKRIIRALLVNGIQTQQELRSCCMINKHASIANGNNKKQALLDIKRLMNPNKDFTTMKFSRKRTSDEAICHAVNFILSTENVKTTSWGSVDKLITPTETIVLPKIQRITTRKIMWESYIEAFNTEDNRGKPTIGRTSFLLLCRELTSCDELVLSSVDYVQALLLTEPIDLLQDITDKITVPSVSIKLTNYLQSLSNFLKYQYPKHILKDDNNDTCCTHGLEFCLGRNGSTYDASKETKNTDDITCYSCRFYSFVCNTLKSKLIDEQYFPQSNTEMVQDAIEACDDCENKLQMYMAHRVRCTNQNTALQKIEDGMIDKLKQTDGKLVQAIMIADFKMKFEPISSRETTLSHYGKRGIGWHGVHLMYYRLEEHVNDDGITVKVPVKYAVYLDQILADTNKQDCLCVFSMIDAALQQIKVNLPFLTELILQSDNANCYQNNFLVCAIALLNACHQSRGLRIIQFVHTETQDGKTVLDAHFATCMRFLTHFMRTWYKNRVTKINTAKGLGYALAWKGGIPNVMVQVVKMNRPHVLRIFQKFQPIVNQLKKYFSRVNMKYFLSSSGVHTGIENVLEQINTLKCQIGIQSYSNIDVMSTFTIDFNTKKVYPSNHVQNEMHFLLSGERLHVDSQHEDDEYINSERDILPITNNDDILRDKDNSHNSKDDEMGSTVDKDEDFEITDMDPNKPVILDKTLEIDDNEPEDEINFVHTEKQLQKRVYTTPDANGPYKPDDLISKVKIVRIMEIGKITTHQKFERKDKKKQVKKIYDNERNDLLAKALRYASHHISTGGISIKRADKDDKTLEDAKGFSVPRNTYFKKGWARRNTNKHEVGGLYGRKYILNYKKEIQTFYDKGKKNSGDKMNPAQMREALQSMYPNKFRIPSETEIKQEISKLFQGSKKGDDNDDADELNSDDDDMGPKTNDSNENKSWEAILEQLVRDNFNLRPEDIWRKHLHELIETYKFENVQIPDKPTVKKKISSLKAKYKKKAMSDLV